jgi:predicted amidophosphoribosyltransferase
MFPNPQDALPLPSRPSVERYKKLAKELVKAAKSGDETDIGEWADHWIRRRMEEIPMRTSRFSRHWRTRARRYRNFTCR